MQSKIPANTITVASLALELEISESEIISALKLDDKATSETVVSATNANKMRKTIETLKSPESPVQLKLVARNEDPEDDNDDKHRGGGRNQLSTEEVKAIAKQTKTPQYMIESLSKAVFEQQARVAYARGQEQAQIKRTLQALEHKGFGDFETRIQTEELIGKSQELETDLDQTLSNIDYYDQKATLERMGVAVPRNMSVTEKPISEIEAREKAIAVAIAKLQNGEELTDAEKKISVIRLMMG
jgi:hypothetical protein